MRLQIQCGSVRQNQGERKGSRIYQGVSQIRTRLGCERGEWLLLQFTHFHDEEGEGEVRGGSAVESGEYGHTQCGE